LYEELSLKGVETPNPTSAHAQNNGSWIEMRGRISGRNNLEIRQSGSDHPAVEELAKGSRFDPERKIRKTIKRRRFLHNIARHNHGTHVNHGERLKGERLLHWFRNPRD
jgi:hypothetical protein